MAISCGNPDALIAHIEATYLKAKKSVPAAIQTKFDFPDGFYVNVFRNGTVSFQGKASDIQGEIESHIEILNRQ